MGTGTRTRGTSSAAVRSLAFAAAGLFVMAVVGATPRSPYQPTLTPNGRPRGPLRDLATALHLDVVHGDPQLAIGVVVAVIATVGFLLLLREAFRGTIGLAAAAVLVIGAHALLLFEPLLFSNDVYSYAYYGRIAAIYGGNPYVQTPLDHTGDLLWNYVGPRWVDTPAVYGPAWTSLSAVMSRFLPAAGRSRRGVPLPRDRGEPRHLRRDRVDGASTLAGAHGVRARGLRGEPGDPVPLGRERAQRPAGRARDRGRVRVGGRRSPAARDRAPHARRAREGDGRAPAAAARACGASGASRASAASGRRWP